MDNPNRTYKRKLEAARGNMSPEQIRAAKCSATRNRNEARKAENIQRYNDRQVFTPQEQLRRLDQRLGKGIGAKRERARLANLITE